MQYIVRSSVSNDRLIINSGKDLSDVKMSAQPCEPAKTGSIGVDKITDASHFSSAKSAELNQVGSVVPQIGGVIKTRRPALSLQCRAMMPTQRRWLFDKVAEGSPATRLASYGGTEAIYGGNGLVSEDEQDTTKAEGSRHFAVEA